MSNLQKTIVQKKGYYLRTVNAPRKYSAQIHIAEIIITYTSSPTPSRLVRGPVPRTILPFPSPPLHNIRTRDSAVPRRKSLQTATVKRSHYICFLHLARLRRYIPRDRLGGGEGEGEEGRADILFTTIHGGERSSRGPCTVTTTRKEVDIIPTYDGSYR